MSDPYFLANTLFPSERNWGTLTLTSQSTAPVTITTGVVVNNGVLTIRAGTESYSSGSVVFSNSNNVTFGGSNGTITASASYSQSHQPVVFGDTGGYSTMDTLVFSNSNGISFGISGSTLTASVATQPAGTISAGTQSVALGEVVFSNSNGVAFGLSGSTITASYTVPVGGGGSMNFSAGTTSGDLDAVVFSNAHGVSFGLDGSTITASIASNYLTTQSAQAVSAGNGSVTFQTLKFVNSNGVTFSTGAAGIIATVKTDYLTSQSSQALSGSNGSFTFQTASFGALNGFTFYTTSGSLVGMYTVPVVSDFISGFAVSAGTTSSNLSGITFSDTNNLYFGLDAGVITASAPIVFKDGLGATAMQTFWNFGDIPGFSFSVDGDSINPHIGTEFLTSQSNQAFSAGGAASTFQTLVFQDSNGISFSNNAGSVRLTHGLQFTSATSAITSNALNTSASRVINIVAATDNTGGGSAALSSNVSFSNANAVSFYTSAGGAIVGSVNTSYRASNDAVGLNTALTANGVAWTVNSSGISLNVPAFLTTAMLSNAATISNINISGGTTSSNLSNLKFIDSYGVSWSLDTGSKLYATVKTDYQTSGAYLTTAALSSQTLAFSLSGNTATTNSSQILNGGYALAGGNGVTLQQSNNTISFSVATNYQSQGAYLTTAALSQDSSKYAGTGVTTAGGAGFSGTLNTAGLSVSIPAWLTTADLSANSSKYVQNWKLSGNTAGTTSSAQGTDLWLAGGNGVTLSGSSNTISFSVATNYQSQGAYLTTADLSANSSKYVQNWKLTGNTAGTTSSAQGTDLWFSGGNSITVSGSSNSIVFSVGAYITTARGSTDAIGLNTAKTNVTWTANSSGLSFDAGGYAGTGFTSAGANISLSGTLNTAGLSLSASVAAPGAAAENNNHNLLGANTAGNTTASGSTIGLSGINVTLSGVNNSVINISAPATSSISGTGQVSIAVNASTISIGVPLDVTFSNWCNIDEWADMVTGGSGITQTSGSSIFVQPFTLPVNVSASFVRLLASYNDSAVGTAGTTSANTSFSVGRFTTFALVLYTAGVGASSRSIQYVSSTTVGLTGKTFYTAGAVGSQYTITVQKTFPQLGFSTNSYTSSYAVSSSSIVVSSNSNTLFTGPRFLDIPWASSLPPGNYWFGLGASTSSASNSSNISFAGTNAMPMTIAGVSQSNVSVGLLGAATSASDHQLQPGLGVWTTNASLISTSSMGLNSISQVASNPVLPFQFIRQA